MSITQSILTSLAPHSPHLPLLGACCSFARSRVFMCACLWCGVHSNCGAVFAAAGPRVRDVQQGAAGLGHPQAHCAQRTLPLQQPHTRAQPPVKERKKERKQGGKKEASKRALLILEQASKRKRESPSVGRPSLTPPSASVGLRADRPTRRAAPEHGSQGWMDRWIRALVDCLTDGEIELACGVGEQLDVPATAAALFSLHLRSDDGLCGSCEGGSRISGLDPLQRARTRPNNNARQSSQRACPPPASVACRTYACKCGCI